MSAGTTIVVGPNTINQAISALQGGGSINFDGASGPLDFDPATGEAPSDIDIWCVDIDSGTGQTLFVSDTQHYDAAMGEVVGAASCP
jgi:branched-chain amino acid transport system substrate-binding protein